MGTGTGIRCKGCNAPLLSGFEKAQGKCTACLHLARTKATRASEPSEIGETAKAPRYTKQAHQVYHQGKANTAPLTCKVSSETREIVRAICKRNAQTQSRWLRRLVEREVYQDQDSR